MDSHRLIEAAVEGGHLRDDDLARARDERDRRAARGDPADLLDVLIDLRLLDRERLSALEQSAGTGVYRGQMAGDFRIRHRLGSGGMGDVFIGLDPSGREVAVKILPGRLLGDDEHRRRFQREIAAMRRLDHPHITAFIDAGECDGKPYLAMELVRGPSLKERLREHGALSQDDCCSLIIQLAGALDHARSCGVVHRDLKPANILLGAPPRGEPGPFTAKICDFGLVRMLDEDSNPDAALTASGMALGTPHYMSPEQATGEKDIDHRSDIYSLGATVFHAVLGRTLYAGRTSAVIMYKQATEQIDVSPLLERGIDDGLAGLLRDMLRKERDARPATWDIVRQRAETVRAALRRRAAVEASPQDDAAPRAARPGTALLRRRRQRLVPFLVIGAAVLVLGATLVLVAGGRGSGSSSAHTDLATHIAADSEQLAQALAQAADDPRPLRILVEPGLYSGPWRLPARSAPLHLLCSNVVLRAGEDGAAIIAGNGVRAHIQGLALNAPGGIAVRVDGDGELELLQCSISGQSLVEIESGALTLREVRADAALRARGGRVRILNSVLRAPAPALDLRECAIDIDGLRVQADSGPDDSPAMRVALGSLTARRLLLQAGSVANGLDSDEVAWLVLRESRCEAAATAWRSRNCQAGVLLRLHLAAPTALAWDGPRPAFWSWSGIETNGAVSGIALGEAIGAGPEDALFSSLPQFRNR